MDLSDPERLETLISLLSGIKIDLIAGGPPCQPFSRAGRSKIRSLVEAGKRPEGDKRRALWQSFLRVVEEVGPTAVLMENVPDMALGDDMATLRVMSDRLERLGYEVDAALVDAWKYGVPQHRQRLILVALSGGSVFKWPEPQKKVSVKDAIGDLPTLGDGIGARELTYHKASTKFQKRARAGMKGNLSRIVWDHITRPVREDDREAFELMTPGSKYSELPEHLRRYRDDIFDDKYNRLSWSTLSRSITAHIAKDGYWYVHPSESRTLTVREAARIQTFPDKFRFAGTRSHAFTQIGNAVPPALAEAIAAAIIQSFSQPKAADVLRPSQRLSQIRSALLEWAQLDSSIKPWRYPGDPWQVLVGQVIGARSGRAPETIRAFLAAFPAPEHLAGKGDLLTENSAKEPSYKSLQKLMLAAEVIADRGWDSEEWEHAAELSRSDVDWICHVGLGEDLIHISASTLRVTARVMGRNFDEERCLSDGKMALGRLLGAEENTPTLTAALSSVGSSICLPAEPKCPVCPLKGLCVTSPSQVGVEAPELELRLP
jgi:DNA (cytosine-5)-methyltransferase 1